MTFTAGAAITVGQALLFGTILGVSMQALANGETGEAAISGVATVTKITSQAFTQGAKLYWDDTNKRLTTTASGNTLVGIAFAAAATSDATCQILLNVCNG